jgi:hypothetical protein
MTGGHELILFRPLIGNRRSQTGVWTAAIVVGQPPHSRRVDRRCPPWMGISQSRHSRRGADQSLAEGVGRRCPHWVFSTCVPSTRLPDRPWRHRCCLNRGDEPMGRLGRTCSDRRSFLARDAQTWRRRVGFNATKSGCHRCKSLPGNGGHASETVVAAVENSESRLVIGGEYPDSRQVWGFGMPRER